MVQDTTFPNLTEPSLIRLDNARYHCTKPASAPKVGKAKKAEIQHVLTTLGMSFSAKDTLPTLRLKLKAYVASVDAEIVQLAKEQGHEVLYTPPYHCDLQPIEMVWSQVKGVGHGDRICKCTDDAQYPYTPIYHTKMLLKQWKMQLW